MGTSDIMVLSKAESEHTGHVISRLFEPVYLACVAQTALEFWEQLSHLLLERTALSRSAHFHAHEKLPEPRPTTSGEGARRHRAQTCGLGELAPFSST